MEPQLFYLKNFLLKNILIKDRTSKDNFIKSNLGLVHSCAHKFKGRGIEYDDLFSAGSMGLIKAFDGFDEDRGVKFSTYAVPVILGEMKRLFRDGGALKVSRSLKELSLKVFREKEYFLKKTGIEPSLSQIAESLDVSIENVIEAINSSHHPISLTINDDEDDENKQIDIKTDNIEDKISDIISLKEVILLLTESDRKLIIYRYFQNKTQKETSKLLKTTQVQISRREKKILLYLRQKLIN